jgi:hypothetical protein
MPELAINLSFVVSIRHSPASFLWMNSGLMFIQLQDVDLIVALALFFKCHENRYHNFAGLWYDE